MLIGLLALQLLMKAPIWYLFARMSDLLGMGGGWYRSALIDAAVGHFAEWGLMGAVYTAHWMPFQLTPNMADITNQYIGEGVDGGAISMVLFIGILVSAYRDVGIGRVRSARRLSSTRGAGVGGGSESDSACGLLSRHRLFRSDDRFLVLDSISSGNVRCISWGWCPRRRG